MSSVLRYLLNGFVFLTAASAVLAQSGDAAKVANEAITSAQTVSYCEALEHPEKFSGKMIRVRALYEADFEKEVITAPPCDMPFLMTWVKYDKHWESRSKRHVRHALSKLKWGVQADVVFVGLFKTDGHYGHMDMYHSLIEVYRVEEVRASGGFQPLPEQKALKR